MTVDPFTPPPVPDLPDDRVEQHAAHLVRECAAVSRGRRRILPFLAVPAVVAAGVGGAWAAGVFDGTVREPERVACYVAADLAARSTDAIPALSGDRPGGRSPRALCAPFFQRGYLQATDVPAGPDGVPPLQACLGGGVVRVFPATSPEVCERLGLEPMSDAAYRDELQRLARVYETAQRAVVEAAGGEITFSDDGTQVTTSSGDDACLSPRAARTAVQQALERADLAEGMRIVDDPRVDASSCVDQVDGGDRPDGHTIVLRSGALDPGRVPTEEETDTVRRETDAVCERGRARSAGELLTAVDCEIERRSADRPPEQAACVTPRLVESAARATLKASGLENWEVEVSGGRGRDVLVYPSGSSQDARVRVLRIELSTSRC